MGNFSEKIEVLKLDVGMHVTELDRPWHETPFPIQGFYIRSEDEISALKFYCSHVYVEMSENEIVRQKQDVFKNGSGDQKEKPLKVAKIEISKPETHKELVPIHQELRTAAGLIQDIHQSMSVILTRSLETGEVDFDKVTMIAEEMTASIIRNPGALLFLSRIKNKDAETYNHSIKTSIWAMIIAREYGLPEASIKNIGRSGLLSKIGREAVMQEIAKNPKLTSQERARIYREYPRRGGDILKESKFHKVVEEAVRYHRERHDGSGFPYGITGDKIPLSAKILGIADYYEFLVESRDGKMGMSPSSVCSHLFNSRDILFQSDLIEKLIETIGVYPIGSNVILSNGKMAVITEQSKEKRLYPVVRVIKDEFGNSLEQIEEIDLSIENMNSASPITIKSCLPFHSAPEELLNKSVDSSSHKVKKINKKTSVLRMIKSLFKRNQIVL